MEIKVFDIEFVERTKKIIENPSPLGNEYNTTLLINCMLALVALPTEKTSNSQRNKDFKSSIINKLNNMGVIKKTTDEDKLFRTIKNALSHMHIEIKNNKGQISEILFWDKIKDSNEYHTILKFTPRQLKEFALFVADKHLKRLSNKNNQQNLTKY